MNEKQIDTLAKGIWNLIVREGPLEDFHAEKRIVGNKEMEAINRFGFNRLGYILKLLFEDCEKFMSLCTVGALPLSYFDPLDFKSDEVKSLDVIIELAAESDWLPRS